MKTEQRNGLLSVSASTTEIEKVAIVQLNGLTMDQWCNKQSSPPDIMINASLWDEKGAIGTIYQNSKLVRNEGTGFGFGINKLNHFGFGDPWNIAWVDYITGFPALVQDGKALNHSVNSSVMNGSTKRSVIATAGDRLYFITANNMTVSQLRTALLNFGVYHAINLDGGGSSRLLVNGKAVNNPTDNRKCPNAIAVWLRKTGQTEDKNEQDKEGANGANGTSPSAPANKKFKVAIDAGHGLYTSGKRCLKSLDSKETREWTLNQRIATYACERLGASGIDCIRIDDITGAKDIPLAERTTKANSANCDFYISIHHDAGVNGGSGGGITAFVYPTASKQSVTLRDNVYKHIIKETGLKGNRSTPLQTANLHVVRETKMPAMLIECGFMDSSADVPIILTDAFAQSAAKGIANGFFETVGIAVDGSNDSGDKNDENGSSNNNNETQEIYKTVQARFGFENDTMEYLKQYKYNEALLKRLAECK